jgi:hypothetical protein
VGAVVVLALLLGIVGWRVSAGLRTGEVEAPLADAPPGALASDALDQALTIRAVRDVAVRVIVDGEVAFEGTIRAQDEEGQAARLEPFLARDRIEVEVPAVEAVRLTWNGTSVVPQGRQDVPRRLVFIDDVGAGR